MRTHGWGGHVPRNDAEAIERILDATQSAMDAVGSDVSVSMVARDLNVTRQTVYRYFPSTDELVEAAAWRATAPFLQSLVDRTADITEPGEFVCSALALLLEEVPQHPYLGIGLSLSGVAKREQVVLSARAYDMAVDLLHASNVDWSGRGYSREHLTEIVDQVLNFFLAQTLATSAPARTGVELRAYLGRWLGVAIDALPTSAAVTPVSLV